MRLDVSVILPTFREAGNLPRLLPEIHAVLRGAALAHEIVVVDDDSRDGTEEACARLAASLPVRALVRRGVRGLATAVVRGFEEARGEVLVVMDADGSHPPARIPDLVGAVSGGAFDMAIGSRYVQGGATVEGHGLWHHVNSRLATLLARPLTRVRDPMSGFMAVRRETLEAAGRLRPLGYKIGLELIVRCPRRPGERRLRVCEIPITFGHRRHGKSKLGMRAQLAYLRHLLRLYAFALARRLAR